MKRSLIFSLLFTVFITSQGFSQKNDISKNQLLDRAIVIDGNFSEWNDSLRVYNPEANITYAVGNNDSTFYLAVKTADPQMIRKILTFGFSFSINKEGKKKPEITVTYPYIDRVAMPVAAKRPAGPPDFNKLNKLQLAKVKGVIVKGLKELPDGNIALKNEYGIQATATIDDKNIFRYELSVPLQYLNLEASFDGTLAYNFKINGLERTVLERSPRNRSYGYGGYGYGYGGYGYGDDVYRRKITDAIEFWEKYKLAGN
ncbi:hypothetical protein [Rubrolithibacter danxiaensis]|uniref:hypothetical protein n=1 Tax=Rubrolithibacter danxiaensis TaxID=3390805 RepID=UPI003BF8F903